MPTPETSVAIEREVEREALRRYGHPVTDIEAIEFDSVKQAVRDERLAALSHGEFVLLRQAVLNQCDDEQNAVGLIECDRCQARAQSVANTRRSEFVRILRKLDPGVTP